MAELGAVDLVIIDEASQSDVTELPALLRGKKILVVGDDRQVSPTAPFVTQEKIAQLRHHYLGDMPFKLATAGRGPVRGGRGWRAAHPCLRRWRRIRGV
jgi:hypothetical protein